MQSLKELYRIGKGPSSSHTIGPEKACNILKNKYLEVRYSYELNNDEIPDFNMFAEIMDIILEYNDEGLTGGFGEEKLL